MLVIFCLRAPGGIYWFVRRRCGMDWYSCMAIYSVSLRNKALLVGGSARLVYGEHLTDLSIDGVIGHVSLNEIALDAELAQV